MPGRLREWTLSTIKWAVDYRSWETACLIQRNLCTIGAPLRPDGGRIRVDALDLTLDPRQHEEILRAMPAFLELKAAGALYAFVEGGRVMRVQIGTAIFETEIFHSIFVLREVFSDEIYGLATPEPMFVWDIGANMGAAAIYFATICGWDVAAYELFPSTAQEALRNIKLSGVADKVHLSAAGIGAKTGRLRLPYSKDFRECNGLFGNLAPGQEGEAMEEDVDLVDAASAFETVRDLAGGRPIYLKLDCEGAEYEIVQRLDEIGALRQIAAIAIETHRVPGHDPEALFTRLAANDFVVFGPRRFTATAAMFRALRSDKVRGSFSPLTS